MEQLLKEAKLTGIIKNITGSNVKVAELYAITSKSNTKVIDKIRKLFPDMKVFDCHQLKAALHDLQKSGKIHEILQAEERAEKADVKKQANVMSEFDITATPRITNKRHSEELDSVTPDKKEFGKAKLVGIENLRGRKKNSSNTFKRREALNKKGWGKQDNQMTMDKFLVPRKRKKTESSNFLMMG